MRPLEDGKPADATANKAGEENGYVVCKTGAQLRLVVASGPSSFSYPPPPGSVGLDCPRQSKPVPGARAARHCVRRSLTEGEDGDAPRRLGTRPAQREAPAQDAVRDEWLATQGARVLRYPASEVSSNLQGVVGEIMTIALDRRDKFES